jgi:hypothetical protein
MLFQTFTRWIELRRRSKSRSTNYFMTATKLPRCRIFLSGGLRQTLLVTGGARIANKLAA